MSNVFVQESTKSSTDKAEMGGGELWVTAAYKIQTHGGILNRK